MGLPSTTNRLSSAPEAPAPEGFYPKASSPEAESLVSLAQQWRKAYAVADAQEHRLDTLLDAAARIACGEEGAAADGQTVHTAAAADRDWRLRADAVNDALGVPAVERAANGAWQAVEALAQRLLATPPANVQEAALKFGVLLSVIQANGYDGDTPERLNGFLEDLTRLAGPASN